MLHRFQLELALQQLLNSQGAEPCFEELLLWGRVAGETGNYYIAIGIYYGGRYEFPEKKFFWCCKSNGMVFEPFPELNDFHLSEYDKLAKLPFKGDPKLVHKEVPKKVLTEEEKAAIEAKKTQEPDPLESTEEEDPEANIVRLDLTEINRLHYHVLAIENDCHIVPHGAMKLTTKHEVERNQAFLGLK